MISKIENRRMKPSRKICCKTYRRNSGEIYTTGRRIYELGKVLSFLNGYHDQVLTELLYYDQTLFETSDSVGSLVVETGSRRLYNSFASIPPIIIEEEENLNLDGGRSTFCSRMRKWFRGCMRFCICGMK